MQQHTGVPPIIMQQQQPAFMQAIMQSQQPWIMSQQALSPLVHVMEQPSLVISIRHAPIVMLQQHTIMPFIVQHIEHMPPAIMEHRFCIIVQEAMSSHIQVSFIPPVIFSIFMVQRGTITMFGIMAGMEPIGMPAIPVPTEGMAIADRSIIIVFVMFNYLLSDVSEKGRVGTLQPDLLVLFGKINAKILEIPRLLVAFLTKAGKNSFRKKTKFTILVVN